MADRYDEPDQGSNHASDEDRCDDRREDPMPGQEAPGLCVHGGELLIRRQRTAVDVEGGFTATWFDLGATTLMAGRSGDHGLVSPRSAGPTAMIIVTVAGIDAHYEHAVEVGADAD